MRRLMVLALAALVTSIVATALATVVAWLRDRRVGAGFVNGVIDPVLVRHGLAGSGRSEIGTVEHIGRGTGSRRLTPVHPVPTEDGFRIVVPLGESSEWARNVLAAGHCRLQLHDIVHELDEPALVDPRSAPGLSMPVRWTASRLGIRYLLLHRFASAPGSLLEAAEPTAVVPAGTTPELATAPA
jgi:hypothetical protein